MEEVRSIRITNRLRQLVTLYVWRTPERRQGDFRILQLQKQTTAEIDPWEMTQYVYNSFVAGHINMEKLA